MFKAVNLRKLLTSLVPPYLAALLGLAFTAKSMNIYEKLVTPPLSPLGIIFPIVWSVLYTLMGIAFYIVRSSAARPSIKKKGYTVFYLQLVFNFMWPILFFRLMLYELSAIWLSVLIVLVVLNTGYFAKAKKEAGILLVPYILWSAFALYLNIGISILN